MLTKIQLTCDAGAARSSGSGSELHVELKLTYDLQVYNLNKKTALQNEVTKDILEVTFYR